MHTLVLFFSQGSASSITVRECNMASSSRNTRSCTIRKDPAAPPQLAIKCRCESSSSTPPQSVMFSKYSGISTESLLLEFPGIYVRGKLIQFIEVGSASEDLILYQESKRCTELRRVLTRCLDSCGHFKHTRLDDFVDTVVDIKELTIPPSSPSESDNEEPAAPRPTPSSSRPPRKLFTEKHAGALAQLLQLLATRHRSLVAGGYSNDRVKYFLDAFFNFCAFGCPENISVACSTANKENQKAYLTTHACYVLSDARTHVYGNPDIVLKLEDADEGGRVLLIGAGKTDEDVSRGKPGEGQLLLEMLTAFVNGGLRPVWGICLTPKKFTVYSIEQSSDDGQDDQVLVKCHWSKGNYNNMHKLIHCIRYVCDKALATQS